MKDCEKRALSIIGENIAKYRERELSLIKVQSPLYGLASGIEWCDRDVERFLENKATSLENYIIDGVDNDNDERQKISSELEKIRDKLDVILRRGFIHEEPFSGDNYGAQHIT